MSKMLDGAMPADKQASLPIAAETTSERSCIAKGPHPDWAGSHRALRPKLAGMAGFGITYGHRTTHHAVGLLLTPSGERTNTPTKAPASQLRAASCSSYRLRTRTRSHALMRGHARHLFARPRMRTHARVETHARIRNVYGHRRDVRCLR